MSKIQQIPFYLPLNVNFDSTQILGNTYYDEYDWAYSIGSSLSFYDPLSKFVVVDTYGSIVKEHVFLTINGEGSSTLFPIMIKTYNTQDKYDKYDPKTILLRSGIAGILTQIGTLVDTKYYFLPQLYLQKAIDICYADDVDKLLMHTSNALTLVSTYNSLEYINNEANPSVTFDFIRVTDELYHRNVDYSYITDVFGKHEVVHSLIELFSPKTDYPLAYDRLSYTTMYSDRVNTRDIISSLSISGRVVEDNLAMTNPFLDRVISQSTNVIFALNTANQINEVFTFSCYVLYELLQQSPFKEGYIKYILLPDGTINIDTNSLLLVNWYYNLRYDGRLHNTQPLHWVTLLTQEVQCLLDSINASNRCNYERYVEIIIQDYHAAVTIIDREIRTTIVFDMLVLPLLSKTLFFTEDKYTNDQYCYNPKDSITL